MGNVAEHCGRGGLCGDSFIFIVFLILILLLLGGNI